ncbi:GbsR/MarR family transcriptional regulator [Subtercola sp. YIM 133946]|uniref:GbsR/MarR family transcriptional regulator n=1 Tax=Subtercola sp. YIM 133946 TaxID=3118909 RepID=UPI002F93192B
MARDDEAVTGFVEQSAATLTNAGFPKMPARVLMALMASEEGGLTAAALADQLGVSAAAISGAVRYLQTTGIIRRVAQSGSRRDRYELPDDPWYAASVNQNPVYLLLAALADQGVRAIGDAASAASQRIDEMGRFYRFMNDRMPALLEEWERLRAQQ